MIDWSRGYSASYYAEQVDPATWRDVGVIEITGGTIKRENEGKRQSADIDCINYQIPIEQWIRVYMDIEQAGSSAHIPLFTGLATTPDRDMHGALSKNSLACYSVLKPAEDIVLERGWYAMAGSSAGDIITDLLFASPAPVEIEDSIPSLFETIVAEDNETCLSMLDKVLDAIGWRLRIDGDGTIQILPSPSDAVANFDPLANDVIEPDIKISQDWSACPNVYVAVSRGETGIARDDDPSSPLSTISRGREVWIRKSGVTLADNESIVEYAARMLREAQRAELMASYTRRYVPEVMPGDLIELKYPEQNLNGLFEVGSQSVKLGHCAATSEEVRQVV